MQVRSTAYESHRGYAVHTYVYVKRKMVALTADDIDCIVAYIVPLDLWYVLPVEAFAPCKNLWFYPHGSKKGSRFESFREAWWLLAPNLKPACTEKPPAEPPPLDKRLRRHPDLIRTCLELCRFVGHPNQAQRR